jgi:hypothetical protein
MFLLPTAEHATMVPIAVQRYEIGQLLRLFFAIFLFAVLVFTERAMLLLTSALAVSEHNGPSAALRVVDSGPGDASPKVCAGTRSHYFLDSVLYLHWCISVGCARCFRQTQHIAWPRASSNV